MGKSWGRVLAGQAESPRTEQDYLAWEIFGNGRCGRGTGSSAGNTSRSQGDWSCSTRGRSRERKDLAAERPDKVKALMALWDDYVRKNNVILPSRSMFETLDDQLRSASGRPGLPAAHLQEAVCAAQDMMADPKP